MTTETTEAGRRRRGDLDPGRAVDTHGSPQSRAGASTGRVALPIAVLTSAALVGLLGPQVLALFTIPEVARTGTMVLLFVSLLGLNIASYIAWPSAWNIPAHLQLASGIVVYGTAIFFTATLTSFDQDVVVAYMRILAVGFIALTAGAVAGAAAARRVIHAPLAVFADDLVDDRAEPSRARLAIVVLLAVVGLALAFAVMGFIPALAADPIAAKFFRAQYAAPYAKAAPLFRAATGGLTVLIPLGIVVALRRRSAFWVLVTLAAVGGMLLTLQRDAATAGLLLVIGIVLAAARRLPVRSAIFVVLLIGFYAFGAVSYYLLGWGDSYSSAQTPFEVIVAGTPDVSDQLHFLTNWLSDPQYTFGRTFVGGLVPGQYEWNSSVWALNVISPGADQSQILSGGIRLPAPIWGLVAFGWPGLVAVSFVSGVIISVLAWMARLALQAQSRLYGRTLVLVVYLAASDAFTVFYRLQYLQVLEFVVCWFIVRGLRGADRRAVVPTR